MDEALGMMLNLEQKFCVEEAAKAPGGCEAAVGVAALRLFDLVSKMYPDMNDPATFGHYIRGHFLVNINEWYPESASRCKEISDSVTLGLCLKLSLANIVSGVQKVCLFKAGEWDSKLLKDIAVETPADFTKQDIDAVCV